MVSPAARRLAIIGSRSRVMSGLQLRLKRSGCSAAGHQLRHQVQAGGVDVAGGVAVVAADVILLGRFAVQQAAGLHEKLLDTDVGGKLSRRRSARKSSSG
jgi:hypothetical protein